MMERELLRRAAAGDERAFHTLYEEWADRVHGKLYQIVGPDADLDDLLQTTFIQVFKELHTFRGDSLFGTWLYRIAVNVALGHLRRKSRWRNLLRRHEVERAVDVVTIKAPDHDYLHREGARVLHGVLERLKPDKRIVLVLYEIAGHTLVEIAELLQVPLNTVAGRLRVARIEARREAAKHHRVDALSPILSHPDGEGVTS
jgi:RNA polymerase sigma-70 factor (ECF subfamily)